MGYAHGSPMLEAISKATAIVVVRISRVGGVAAAKSVHPGTDRRYATEIPRARGNLKGVILRSRKKTEPPTSRLLSCAYLCYHGVVLATVAMRCEISFRMPKLLRPPDRNARLH